MGRSILAADTLSSVSRRLKPAAGKIPRPTRTESNKMEGKPCIRGLRMTVYDVLDYLASGISEDEILEDFPDLTREDN